MTGVIATMLAVAIIGGLMIVGIRTKLSPPDPDWREHLPKPGPPPPRWWWVVWLSRYPVLVAAVIAAGFEAEELAGALGVVMVILSIVGIAVRWRMALRARRQPRPEAHRLAPIEEAVGPFAQHFWAS
jgi:hypothetical protein